MYINLNKKAIGPVVATALLLVVVVIGVIGFQTWFVTFQSGVNSDVEIKSSNGISSSGIETIVSNKLYFKNGGNNNITILKVEMDGFNCNISGNYSSGVKSFDISDCINNITTSIPEIVVFTTNNIFNKKIYIDLNQINSQSVSEPIITSSDFISLWNVSIDTGSSGFNNLTLPLQIDGTYNFLVDWGDGNNDTITIWNQSEVTHNYLSGGEYIVNISGTIDGWAFNDTFATLNDNLNDGDKLIDILNWGTLKLSNSGTQFSNCENLVGFTALDSPNLTSITNMVAIFSLSSNFNGDLNSWDVSSVTNMSSMFYNATSFNQPLNSWDVSSVTDMSGMFDHATNFNQPLDNWDVSSVTIMSGMFYNTTNFNQPLNSWDVSSVTNMVVMFYNTTNFNQPLSSWNVSSVTNMAYMFDHVTSFNQSLDNWDVSSVTIMSGMFYNAINFNQPLSSWNVSSTFDMFDMFNSATSFNQNLSGWCVSLISSEPGNFALNSPLNSSGLKPVWGTCP